MKKKMKNSWNCERKWEESLGTEATTKKEQSKACSHHTDLGPDRENWGYPKSLSSRNLVLFLHFFSIFSIA